MVKVISVLLNLSLVYNHENIKELFKMCNFVNEKI